MILDVRCVRGKELPPPLRFSPFTIGWGERGGSPETIVSILLPFSAAGGKKREKKRFRRKKKGERGGERGSEREAKEGLFYPD